MASFVLRLLGSIVLGTEVLLLSMSKETEKERKEGIKVLAKPNDD